MRTSETDPIHVDFLPERACGFRGRIGLTFAPGKKDQRAGWNRSLEADVKRLAEHFRASVLISLIEDSELALLGIEDLFLVAERAGIRVRRLPIPDAGIPRSTTDVVALVRQILGFASAGDTVVLHCRAGVGRTGMLASCCLVALGHEPEDALRIVRSARPDTVETREQERFIGAFAAVWRAT